MALVNASEPSDIQSERKRIHAEEKEEKIKKEIFRRYNSGITPLQKYDIDRAAFIDDDLSEHLYNKIYTNNELYNFLCEIILPKGKKKQIKEIK